MLYELLSGRLPREFEPNTSLAQAITRTVHLRQVPLAKANPACKGELDTITMKALAEEPAQRYGSASELGADIERYLRDEPILARAPSAWYVRGNSHVETAPWSPRRRSGYWPCWAAPPSH